jgi:hypothetical protein
MGNTIFSAIFDGTKLAESEPVVQCVQVKALPPQANGQERYKAVFSDISNYVQAMLATREWAVRSVLTMNYLADAPNRSEPLCLRESLAERMFCSTKVIPTQRCQGQAVRGYSPGLLSLCLHW